jgi:hypothetical protein
MNTMNLREMESRAVFGDLQTYCMFLGYPRSGHSLIGALLDAHPNIIMAHELDVLQYIAAGCSRSDIFSLLLRNSQAACASGRKWGEYSYQVPNQWQGRFEKLQVIGDKKGGGSLRRLRSQPQLLEGLRHTIDLNIKFVHVVRNPFDNISTMARHRGHNVPLGRCVGSYFARCQTFAEVSKQIGDADILEVKYESFIANARAGLEELCRFLGVAASVDYLNDCAATVNEAPHRSRHETAWTEEDIEAVSQKMAEFPFLQEYSFAP